MKNSMKELCEEIETLLSGVTIELAATPDGRVNSTLDEDPIVEALKNVLPNRINTTPPRNWYDVLIDGVPFNIKCTTGKSADNSGNYLMLRYAFTNENAEILLNTAVNKTKDIMPLLPLISQFRSGKEIEEVERDYGFIVYNKVQHKFSVVPLKEIEKVTSNPSNLPFQIKWSNLTRVDRSITESFRILVTEPLEAVERSFEVKVYKALYE